MTTDHRRAPRRRGAALETAILAATLAELEDGGYAALSMDAVAERARVSKASLYRRWPGKADLVVDAVYRMLPDAEEVRDTGTLRGDLVAALSDAAAQLDGPAGAGLRGILGDVLADPTAATELRSRRAGRGAAVMREIVRRAAARGELATAEVPERVLQVGHAMLRHEFLFAGRVADDVVESLVDDVLLPLLTASARSSP